MSLSSLQSSLNQVDKEIANLEKKLADFSRSEAQKTSRMNSIQKSITKNTSASMLSSKLRQIQSLQSEIVRIVSNKADITKKISSKRTKRNELALKIQKEERQIAKKNSDEVKRIEATYLQQINNLKQRIDSSSNITLNENAPVFNNDTEEVYDVFISHASEDKESFVNEFVNILQNKLKLKVWYDELSIKWGDSIRVKIDQGLKKCKFGIVVLSRSYISKHWTQYELEGLFQRESNEGKLILPIWHDITKNEILEYSPVLAGKLAMSTATMTIEEIAENLQELVNASKISS